MAKTVADRQMRHEEAAALAACGYAKHCGRLGVCPATSGPSGIHLLNGFYDAKFDGQPGLIEALIEANEPPMPGKISTDPALKFAEAMLRGDKSGWKIITTVMKDRIREVS